MACASILIPKWPYGVATRLFHSTLTGTEDGRMWAYSDPSECPTESGLAVPPKNKPCAVIREVSEAQRPGPLHSRQWEKKAKRHEQLGT